MVCSLITLPLMCKKDWPRLVTTVIDLVKLPSLPVESKIAVTEPVAPGATGSLLKLGTVQPHEAVAVLMMIGAVPLLTKVNVYFAFVPSMISPKS